jgi:hypothetical protein
MKIKKFIITTVAVVGILTTTAYFVVPIIATRVIENKIVNNSENTVKVIDVSWRGPQRISGLNYADERLDADFDVTISNGLISLILTKSPIDVLVRGKAKISINPEEENNPKPQNVTKDQTKAIKQKTPSIPAVIVRAELESLTLVGDEPLSFSDVNANINIDPNMHFVASAKATSELGGTVVFDFSAPSLISSSGGVNLESSANCTFSITDTSIPTIQGVGGWSVLELNGEISSPNLIESINVSLDGSLAEYETPRGRVQVKTQLLKTDNKESGFVFFGKELVGSVDLLEVPTTILGPFLNNIQIDTAKDIGTTMDLRIERTNQSSPIYASFDSEQLQFNGTINTNSGLLSNVSIDANIHNELLQKLSNDQLVGNAKFSVRADQIVPFGIRGNGKPECEAKVLVTGNIHHAETNTDVTSIECNASCSLENRTISAIGSALVNKQKTNFDIILKSINKNKLDGINDLWKTITRQLPQGTGKVVVTNFPTSVIRPYIKDDRINLTQDLGETFDIDATLNHSSIDASAKSKKITASGTMHLKGTELKSFSNVQVDALVTKSIAMEFVGLDKSATIKGVAKTLDLDGNSLFDATIFVDKQRTVVQGKTTRNIDDSIDAHLAATGIPTQYINPLLFDSIGSPLAVELIAKNILDKPIVTAGGTSPNSAFETNLIFNKKTVSTVKKTITSVQLQLTSSLTQHLLKDLGPVLSDIRSIKRPIQMRVTNAIAPLDEDLSTLQADILLDIGEVMLDNGSATLSILSLFDTKHDKHIPAFFEPIQITIKKGVVHYEEFRLTLANKYSIPYSGSINLVNQRLNLHSAVPLTGLGYSIKELRGLATDINVPLLITGTIDKPIVNVDPSFDLGEILQSVALESIGDVIGDLLGNGESKEVPNPLDLIEQIINN